MRWSVCCWLIVLTFRNGVMFPTQVVTGVVSVGLVSGCSVVVAHLRMLCG